MIINNLTFFRINSLFLFRNTIQHINGDWGKLSETLRIINLSDNSICEIESHPDDQLSNGVDTGRSLSSRKRTSKHYQFGFLKTETKIDDHKSFADLQRLMWLDLSGNRLPSVDASLMPNSLVTLDLSRNVFQQMPTRVFELPNLKILLLAGNLLQSIQVVDNDQKVRLEKLDLSENMIQRFHTDLLTGVRSNAINLAKNSIQFLDADSFAGMNVVHLVLAFNRLEHIDGAAFRMLDETLEYLDLERNLLRSTQPEALGRLKRLRYLYLTANHITDVDYLPETLRVLSLAGNNITRIPLASLERCADLSYLNMGYNKIAEVPENGFVGWGGQLQTLLLRNNKITELNYGAFAGLDSIKEISLSFNDIHWIHPNAFENISKSLKILELSFGVYREDFPMEQLQMLTELIWLGLDNNHLKVISDEALITMKELTYINLSFNRIMIVPPNIFVAEIHSHLMEVDLSYNVLYSISPYTFDSLLHLESVSLAHNRIDKLNRHSFNNLPNLNWIDLSHNALENITDTVFSLLPSLQHIDLTFNSLKWFTFNVFKDVSNKWTPLVLNISHNLIRSIEISDNDWSAHLTQLDANHNCINDTVSFQNLVHLRVLHLRYNYLTHIPNNAFEHLEVLEILTLSNNNISSLRRRSFQGLKRLQKLDLSHNSIEQLQIEQFSNLNKLRVLNLRKNQIRTIPRDTFLNTRIEFLDVSENHLSSWPEPALSDIGFTLRVIKVASNNIVYLDDSMFINTQFLYEVNLSNNKLVFVPENTFRLLKQLTELDLGQNRIPVDNLKGIFHFTKNVRNLNLSGMGLNDLPENMAIDLTSLTHLDVGANNLLDICDLSSLKLLHTFNVATNRISNLSKLSEKLPHSLRTLDISNNPIRLTDSESLSGTPFLETLFMHNVRVSNASFFGRLLHLRSVYITGVQHIVDCIADVPGLQHLRIDIPVTVLDSNLFAQLENHTKIRELDISGAHVAHIRADTFNGFRQSQRLVIRIRNTLLTDLPVGLFYVLNTVPHLTIDLSSNQVSSLSPDSFYPNASTWDAVGTRSLVGGLDLYNNPVQCDCGLVWLGHWLRRWLRETAQMNVVTRKESRLMLEVRLTSILIIFLNNLLLLIFSQRAKRNTCIDPLTGQAMSFLDLFPEDLLCHASALSSFSPQSQNAVIKWPFIIVGFVVSRWIVSIMNLIVPKHIL